MDPHRMVLNDTPYTDDDVIQAIEAMYPDPLERREYINRPLYTNRATTLLTKLACTHRRRKLIRYLLRNGADPNVLKSGSHPLSFCRTPDDAMFFLAYGADPNLYTNGWQSILFGHIVLGRPSVADVLMTHGARMKLDETRELHLFTGFRVLGVVSFYDRISLRRIALHHIRLERIRTS